MLLEYVGFCALSHFSKEVVWHQVLTMLLLDMKQKAGFFKLTLKIKSISLSVLTILLLDIKQRADNLKKILKIKSIL